jgi:hypothetical protein
MCGRSVSLFGVAEIDENLIRCNLTPAQEAAAISRRKDL